ncbi:beta/gamma crystallin-related protein [Phenylobacterium sp. Root700]|uniref:beta/gamma crystallin-related protein n=1 Tax=Phenylobacterium sp. Root700 TaxID=1736591 RepID=UPI0006F674AE|nr:beta/gamma crystallin-related protein [Phenylobacterium sp. Root700]KRB43552.1 hypothetical protein ASE02_20275 [Phenylobacterium sp. Root700]
MKTSFAVMALAAAVLAGPAQAQTPAQQGGGFGGGNGGQQGGNDGGFGGGNGGGWSGGNGGQQGGNWGGGTGGQHGGNGGNWGGQQPGWLPQGTYQHTCRGATVRGSGRNATLTASCQDGRGRWNYSSIRYQECRNDIRNDNGRLNCSWGGGGGGGGGGRPPPPWQGGSVMLYSAPDFGGQAYQAEREVSNLPRQYNDRAMSLRIQGRGAWQVCSDSDFRGRCQIFDRDVRDLRQYGLGEAVSSMRPVNGRPY